MKSSTMRGTAPRVIPVLEGRTPENAHVVFDLGNLAASVGPFCEKAYALNLNPLPGLRRGFPNLEWRFVDGVEGWDALVEDIKDAHLVCAVFGLYCVVATLRAGATAKFSKSYWESWMANDYSRVKEDRHAELTALGFEIAE